VVWGIETEEEEEELGELIERTWRWMQSYRGTLPWSLFESHVGFVGKPRLAILVPSSPECQNFIKRNLLYQLTNSL